MKTKKFLGTKKMTKMSSKSEKLFHSLWKRHFTRNTTM